MSYFVLKCRVVSYICITKHKQLENKVRIICLIMENNIQLIAEEFAKIKTKISKGDKEAAGIALNVHPGTITRYLRGDIAKEPFALELLSHFKNVISKREKILAKVTA